ncbi:shikimate dehydrogenase [Bacterioplanoides sp.]|uniref:shikimate dehydrogenase n=1 Tax=Bacterioplanoides sp. TaxID=2066072 RepID=UPI003B5A69CB
MTDLYAVMGNPIGHSKSPQIHTAFAKITDQNMLYSAILVPLDGFDTAVDDFFRRGGKGLNITVPFKEDAWRYADKFTARAQRAEAVNTLQKLEDGTVLADNTDGVGMVRDIMVNQGVTIEGKRVLILGAGGAVRGILQPLLEQKPASVTLANRTVSKAEALANDFADLGDITVSGFAEVAGQFDLIINGTSASLAGELPPVPATCITPDTVSYDMMYGAETTVFNQWALDLGAAKAIDGLGMLVEQAAEAFLLWRDVRPATEGVMSAIREDRRR